MWKKRSSRKPIDCPTVRYFTERFFFLPITVVPERHHRINARFLFYQELPIAFICWQHPLESFLLAPASFATSATKIIRWFNLSHRIVKNLPIQQHGDMMYTAVLYLFYLPKQEPYFILKAHQVNRRNQTVFSNAFSQVRHFVIIENIERVIRKTINQINTDFSDIGFQGGSLSFFQFFAHK